MQKSKTTYTGNDDPTNGIAFITIDTSTSPAVDDWASLPVATYHYDVQLLETATGGSRITTDIGKVEVIQDVTLT